MNIGLSLKTLGQVYIKLDEFFHAAGQMKWTLKGINCTLTNTLRFKYIILVEKTDESEVELEELEDFTQALASEFTAELDAEVYDTECHLQRDFSIGMVELIIE